MVLKTISPGIFVGIAAKIRQYEECRLTRVFGLGLDRLPQLGAEAIRSSNAFDIQRVGSGMRNIDVVHCDPQQTGGNLSHQLARDVQRQLVRAGQSLRVRFEIVDRELQDVLELLQLEVVAFEFGRVIGRFIVVAQQVLIVSMTRSGSAQQMLRQNYARTSSWTKRPMTALANAVEPVAWSDHPCV